MTNDPLNSWKGLARAYRRNAGLLVMAIPFVVYFLVFHYAPMVGLIIAFKHFVMSEGVFGSPWAGLEVFRRLVTGKDFINAFRNTIVLSLLRLGFGFMAPIVLALLLNEIRMQGYRKAIQTLTYIPHFLSWVVLGGIFLMLFSLNGPINEVVTVCGGGRIEFLTNDFWFVFTIVITAIWQSAGYGAVIYLAALSGISPTLYEAAYVDGAGRWKQAIHVTVPCLIPTIVTLLILNLGRIMNIGFDQIYNMYNPSVYDVSDIIGTYVLRRLQTMDYSLATAAGLFKSVIGLCLVVMTNYLAKRMSGGEQGVW